MNPVSAYAAGAAGAALSGYGSPSPIDGAAASAALSPRQVAANPGGGDVAVFGSRSIRQDAAPALAILDDIRANAKKAEEMLWELSYQLKMKTEECARRRKQLNFVPKEVPVETTVDATVMYRTQAMQRRLAEEEGELERDRQERLRLLKRVDVCINGASAPSMTEALVLGRHDAKTQVTFNSLLQSLPAANAQVLEELQFFTFAKMMLHTGVAHHRRTGTVDTERACLAALSATGQKLAMSVVLQTVAADDFEKL